MSRASLPLALLLLLTACGRPSGEPQAAGATATTTDHEQAEIAWLYGDLDAAFATARAEDKPLFLYWGAVWCPPCHYLKNKIFKEPSFVEKSRQFVAVYLDGDTESAQYWGEHFGTAGYPTVIVFDPAGNEVIRMSSGIPVEEYTHVLDTALARLRPVREVLEQVVADGAGAATHEDLNLLAFHSWGQDKRVERSPEELAAVFADLWSATPEEMAMERSRFLALTLEYLAQGSDGEGSGLSSKERELYRDAVIELLGDQRLRNSNIYFAFYGVSDIIDLLEPEPSEGRSALATAWKQSAVAAEDDESLTVNDRLSALYAQVALARLDDEPGEDGERAPLPVELVAHIEERVDWASEIVTQESELQTVMNTMAGLLSQADLLDQAEALLEQRLDDTKSPHYYMSWLSSLREEAGDEEGAISWSRQAYDSSHGPYTRFQWGSSYVRDLVRLAPDDLTNVEAASREVLAELMTNDDAFANRNYSRLKRVDSSISEWADDAERQSVAASIGAFVHAECGRFPGEGEDSQRERCTAFLAG